MIDVRPDAQCGLRLDARVLDCRFNQNLDYFSLRVKAPEPVMHMVRELRHLAGEKWLAFDGLEPLMERLANNRPKLHVALNNLELTITKDTHSMRALIKEFTPCQWSNDEKAWVGIFGNDAEVRDTLNVILEFCTFWGWIVEPEPPLVLGAPQVFAYQGDLRRRALRGRGRRPRVTLARARARACTRVSLASAGRARLTLAC